MVQVMEIRRHKMIISTIIPLISDMVKSKASFNLVLKLREGLAINMQTLGSV